MDAKARKNADSLKVAKLYYQQDYSQNEIAKIMSISRPTVSRLLQYARDMGLVRIEIADPMTDATDMAETIQQRYGLAKVIVVPIQGVAPKDQLDTVAQAAALYLEGIVRDDDIIGIGWGRTLYSIGTHLAPKDVRRVSVVQIKGSVSNTESNNYGFESANAFANAFHTLPQYLPLPVIFEHIQTKELVERETYIRRIIDMGRRANIAVFTVGTVRDSALLFRLGYLTDEEQRRLQETAVGDVISRFIDAHGNPADEDINRRTVGIDLDDLKAKPHSILVVASPSKVPAVHGALAAGYANTLVIDQVSAAELLDHPTVEL
ncbi:sugar-binding transcriptional regulator [Bifidobacterium callimiconis]|uniref:DNA-directed RNA polymerase sigma-70 factor n=1 Tax=Bifidobacterium callimiconis TaxID=2306973 RepID=A0A430FCY8_9BIFI|nr:sugar-binding transcriptional regulator [Bifidobacterium callimiconis]MBT1176815.1 sugar-binding transcriptional regulator [Bifidobacterium callimiconis]RSX50715.1 DNA-directed RNA polymerase sigma-70 factor [Bifidobacterium callimiconis]